MFLDVETCPGVRGEAEPQAFRLGAEYLRVLDIIDRWPADTYTYFKLQAGDGHIYLLRHELSSESWELIFFDQAQPGSTQPPAPGRH